MVDRAQLEATLNERGVAFDHYASDDALEQLVAESDANVYQPAQPARTREQLVAYLAARGLEVDDNDTDEGLEGLAAHLQENDHARFLETYQPVITRLPGAIGTSPEQPEIETSQDEAAPSEVEPSQGESDAASTADPTPGGESETNAAGAPKAEDATASASDEPQP